MALTKFNSALVLSGGSARALTHLGILREIERHHFPVDMIVGCSMGAVVGALYAFYGEIGTTIKKMQQLTESELFIKAVSVATDDSSDLGPDGFLNRFMWLFRRGVYYTHSMIRSTMVPEEAYVQIISELIPDAQIEDLPRPFAAVAMDIVTGEEIVLTTGSLRKAVSASAAIPGILPPVEIHGRTLVDGGWIDNVPVAPAIALGAHFILAVDATMGILGLGSPPLSALESLFRCNEITRIALNRHRNSSADILLVPELGYVFWADFSGLDRAIAAGSEAFSTYYASIKRKRLYRGVKTLGGLLHPARKPGWRHPFVIY
jgi:NTE family protein